MNTTPHDTLEQISVYDRVLTGSDGNLNDLNEHILIWGYSKDMIWRDNRFKQMAKVTEEVGEVAGALCKDNVDNLKSEIGDVFVTLVLLAAQNGLSMNECVSAAYEKIKNRQGEMKDGIFVKAEDL